MMELDDIVAYLTKKYHPKAIILHGSRARGDAFDHSDYDLTLIANEPDFVRPEYYQDCALDVWAISPLEKVLLSGKTPILPCLVLFEDADRLGESLVKRTQGAFDQGPSRLEKEELENRCNFSKRLIQRIQGRGDDLLVRNYYVGNFYERALRYWCEINQQWTMSAYLLLPRIATEDPVFYKLLKDLWTEDYQNAALKIHQHLFESIKEKV